MRKTIEPIAENSTGALNFTLLEVVTAIAILAVGLASALTLASSAANRMHAAAERRHVRHMLTQASEYYLLAGHRSPIPTEFFPYEEYRAECRLMEPQPLPEAVETNYGPWILARYKISIFDRDGRELDSVEIEKIIKETDR